jgi:hypothetical protein
LLLIAGCGSDDSADQPQTEGPLPTGPNDAQAYTESFLAENPRAELQPELLAIARLEPTSGDDDTCADRNGVDCLPYAFTDTTLLTLAADDAPVELAQMVLRDRSGAAVLTQTPGGPPVSTMISPGEYVLELHHASAGSAAAPAPIVFIRPDAEEDTETGVPLRAGAPRSRPRA